MLWFNTGIITTRTKKNIMVQKLKQTSGGSKKKLPLSAEGALLRQSGGHSSLLLGFG